MLKFMRSRRAFTLVELLVAVAILALLAGIAVPVVLHLRGSSQQTAAETELSDVQSAVDNMMTDLNLTALPNEVTVATDDMSQFPDWLAAAPYGYVLYPATNYRNPDADKYIRQATTTGTYTCTDDGTVTQVAYNP